MKIYNSLTSKTEELIPINPGEINMYVCGPTVNKRAHIGNLYPPIFFDTAYRYFKYSGYKVTYASNFTDVDDKIIEAAIEENVSEKEIAKRYSEIYLNDLKNLNCLPVDHRPRVTEFIPDIIEFVNKLLELGYAYKSGDDIYLNVKKISKYGILSNQKTEELDYGNRIEVDSNKENPFDFVLWKKTNEGIKWQAPFGEGRPGWHTECVVMINKIFGNKIDIHGGGIDLKFPHHENEIAQSLAVNNNTLANYWMHNGHLMMNGIKMSKSLGNIINLDDLLDKYDSNSIRLAVLKNYYRSPLSLSDDLFDESQTIEDKIFNVLKSFNLYKKVNSLIIKDSTKDPKIKEIMDDDFNTSNLITYLLETVKALNLNLRNKDDENAIINYNTLNDINYILGLKYELPEISEDDINLYNYWNKYRENKDFENADKIRIQLAENKII